MSKGAEQKAVIYCRVSSAKQTTRGDGLSSQETRCREYAKYKGYAVEAVFTDDMTGGVIDRPGMQAMLKHLRKHRRDPRIAIIDDISRLARSIEAHLQLRSAIASAGASLESPSIEFGEDSDSILVENLLASVSQHQRQKNSEQTLNRMKARLMNGYWVFQAPVGYRYQRKSGQGNMLVRDEPLASIIQEGLEGYASGRFQLQSEVKRFLESYPEYPRDRSGELRAQRVKRLRRLGDLPILDPLRSPNVLQVSNDIRRIMIPQLLPSRRLDVLLHTDHIPALRRFLYTLLFQSLTESLPKTGGLVRTAPLNWLKSSVMFGHATPP